MQLAFGTQHWKGCLPQLQSKVKDWERHSSRMYIFWLTANMRVCEQGVHLIAVGIDMLRPHNY